ncbi:hypothetical protein K431DRAFT_292158 [Polychaeton citri CBS 116435]|uniref:Galactose oxidase n=1 Tax=Polychaeton citri CBS 116435 TaxID=1314669 RepID=A0A9P4USP1_9PEZI|nr:hypothetical protein K431DRAFT_292158 [Polychaeton citri CBS 116435]
MLTPLTREALMQAGGGDRLPLRAYQNRTAAQVRLSLPYVRVIWTASPTLDLILSSHSVYCGFGKTVKGNRKVWTASPFDWSRSFVQSIKHTKMLRNTCLRLLTTALAFSFTTLAQNDPLQDFCRRWGHQTAVVDGKLYIDGGFVSYGGSITPNTTNTTNTYLLYSDLQDDRINQFPPMFDNLTRDSNVPTFYGGALFADSINRYLYSYGGGYTRGDPQTYSIWQYDIVNDRWSIIPGDVGTAASRAIWGGNTVAEDVGSGYWLGGWFDNTTTPGWRGPPQMNPEFVLYDFVNQKQQNLSGPTGHTAYAEGTLNWIPASDGGMLVYFGGVQQSTDVDNAPVESSLQLDMSQVYIYDIRNNDWFAQTATGDVPSPRRRFCAGASWAEDQSSYNIYLYGGLPATGEGVGYGDVYVLSLPSFTWMRYYEGGDPGQHHSASCNILPGNGQMMIIGGAFPNSSNTDCDVPDVFGQHNLNLGSDNVQDVPWYQYLPNLTEPVIPPDLIEVIGGGPTGGATLSAPSGGWGTNTALEIYIGRRYATSTRSATRSLPTTLAPTITATVSGSSGGVSNTGAIAGGVVGGVVGLILVVAIVLLCLRARRRRKAEEAAATSRYLDPNSGVVHIDSSPQMQQHARSPGSLPGIFHEHINSPQDGTGNPPPWMKPQGAVREMTVSDSPSLASPPPQFGSWSPQQQQHQQQHQRQQSTNWTPVMAPHTPPPPQHSQGQQGQYSFPPQQSQNMGLGLQQALSQPQQPFFPPPPDPRQYADPETRHELGAPSPTQSATSGVHEKDANGSSEVLPEQQRPLKEDKR